MRALNILTWPAPDHYLQSLCQLPHHFHLMTNAQHPLRDRGRHGAWQWGENVHVVPVEQARFKQFDCILFQHSRHYLEDQYLYLSESQRQLPRIFLEHDAPCAHPTDARHPADDPSMLLVHVSPFNQLMWDNGDQPTRIIEYGAAVFPDVQYRGEHASGLVVAHHLARRGRRHGSDLYRQFSLTVPLELVGAGSEEFGGHGDMAPAALTDFAAQFRFLFHPARYAGVSIAVIEAMLIGMPVIGIATAEMSGLIDNGVSGYVDTDLRKLEAVMHELLQDPHYAFVLGRGAQRRARERFGMRHFTAQWNAALQLVTDSI
ncbi:hypothetical protein RCH09_001872 [Actimicrobium sp. GrIS 1.19]|uniref:glycosyltransferase n=1 Tax=Actimicrobium sp. GrIS 1.19 TaxID=3071708 RepID=UPI002DFA67A6|nr:hypothetical protein [Actimicrobium sp. GrIS 1.19]